MSVALSASALCSSAAGNQRQALKHDLTNYRYRVESSAAFNNTGRELKREQLNQLMYGNDCRFKRASANALSDGTAAPVPVHTQGPSEQIVDLDAPDGQLWYSTAEMKYDIIPAHDDVYFEDKILREFSFTIYDFDFNVIGVVKDRMEYRDDEVRTVMCEVSPVITRNFFNDTDDIEVVIAFAVNAEEGVNHYRSVVYSLDGEKDEEGYDKPIMSYEALIGDVAEGPRTPDGKDNFYISFSEDTTVDVNPDDLPKVEEGDDTDWSFWEYLCSQGVRFTIYGPAHGEAQPRKLFSKTMPLIKLPGDQQYTPFMLSVVNDGKVYFVQSEYKDTFYNPYSNPFDESMSMKQENELIVNFYLAGNDKVVLDHTTTIKFQKDDSAEALACYHGIGTMRYRQDIDFTHFGGDKPALFVTKDNYVVGSDDAYVSSYYVYDGDGNKLKTLFEGAESTMSLADIEGQEPQQVFVRLEGSYYRFYFVDLVSGKTVNTFTNNFYIEEVDDFELLYANMDRFAENGTYKYAIELRMPSVDENDHDIMRIMWLNNKAEYERIDMIDMGTNVTYAQSYLSATTLDPKFFDDDNNFEYLILIKRAVSETMSEEHLLVGKAMCEDFPEGKDLLSLVPDEKRGILNTIIPAAFKSGNRLTVGYYEKTSGMYTVDYYDLPLYSDNSGIDNIVDEAADNGISIDNGVVTASGVIEVYTMQGALAAKAVSTLDCNTLANGLYIVKADGKATKLLIK
ncbi:MAG: hypothetical protein NC082_07210 [Clostridiales bacterium]|nr:hypothetical protein [Clostridiales bacterium]